MKRLAAILTTVILVFNFSCKDNGTGPEEKKSVRDYTWTADTLAYWRSSQTLMSSIWGSSANDIYICGHNSSAYGNIWHYDGKEWEYIDSTQKLREQFGGAIYRAVHGTAANNVWVVGHSGTKPFILQYNGTNWKKHIVEGESALQSIDGDSPDNIWVCGSNGIIFHYNGSSIIRDSIDIVSYPKGVEFILNSVAVHNGKPYIMAHLLGNANLNQKQTSYFITGDIGNWTIIDSTVWGIPELPFGVNDVYSSTWNKLYTMAWGIFEWGGDKNWKKIFDLEYPISSITGTNENNMIAVGSFNKAYHWNGGDWYLLNQLYDAREITAYRDVWFNDNEAFIIGYTLDGFPQKTVIWHGK